MANDFDESSANEEASKGLSWWYSADVLSRDKSDKTAKRIRRISITDRLLRHPGRLSMVYFGALIIIVTGLLLLPDLFRVNHGNMGRTLWQALFYAVSAYNNTGFTPDATGLVPAGRVGQYRPVPRRRSRHEDAPCDERRRHAPLRRFRYFLGARSHE